MRATPRTPDASGFTMVELLIAMLLLAVTMTGLAALQLNTIRTVTISKRGDEATRLAQSVVERYRTVSFLNLPGAGTDWTVELNDNSTQMTSVGGDGLSRGPFNVERFVEALNSGKEKLITIRVKWTDQAQQEQSVVLSCRRYL